MILAVLEVDEGPGGRCRTTQAGDFADVLVELGPEFAHARHDYTLRACEACGVGLTTEAETDNEESVLALGPREVEIVAALDELAAKCAPECVSGTPPDPDAAALCARLDAVSMAAFLREEYSADEAC